MMTTPERLRRRQRRESSFIALVGLAVLVSSLWLNSQDAAQQREDQTQRECIARNFTDLSEALNARAELAKKDARASRIEAEANRLESRANNEFYRGAFAATGTAEVLDAYGDYRVTMAQVAEMRSKVDRRRMHIADERERNPIPPFPVGTCD